MRVALSLTVPSALLAILAVAVAVAVTEARESGINPAAEMIQLTLADVNQATEQQDQLEQELPAVRLVRQLGALGRFGRFGGGGGPFGGFGGGPFGGGGGRLFGGGGGRQLIERREFFNGGGFGFGRRPGRGFFPPQPLGFFG